MSSFFQSADEVELLEDRGAPTRARDIQLWIGFCVVFVWVLVAITVPLWSRYGPNQINFAAMLQHPSGAHWFGTDELGRDVFTRVMYASRADLPLAFEAVAAAAVVGTIVGCVAAYCGGLVDEVLQRIGDVVLAFPALVLALAIAAALGPSLRNVVIAISAVVWPEYARLVRGEVLTVLNELHVTAAKSIGCGPWRLLRKHVLPFATPSIAVKASVDVGSAVLLAAGLSFIGVGIVPPTPEWGAMVSEADMYISQWWIGLFPGLAILTTVLAFNFMGDSLRDWLDPRSPYGRRRRRGEWLQRLGVGSRLRTWGSKSDD
ncbi:MAG: ABC transporter permease [Acidimicrobiales bacterium]